MARLLKAVCRAASRQVGGTRLTRGQSITLPLDDPRAASLRADPAFRCTEINGVVGKQATEEQLRDLTQNSRVLAARTGLLNRLLATTEEIERLPEELRDALGNVLADDAQVRALMNRLAEAFDADAFFAEAGRARAHLAEMERQLEEERAHAAQQLAELEQAHHLQREAKLRLDRRAAELDAREAELNVQRDLVEADLLELQERLAADDAPAADSDGDSEEPPGEEPPDDEEQVAAREELRILLEDGDFESLTVEQLAELAAAAGLGEDGDARLSRDELAGALLDRLTTA